MGRPDVFTGMTVIVRSVAFGCDVLGLTRRTGPGQRVMSGSASSFRLESLTTRLGVGQCAQDARPAVPCAPRWRGPSVDLDWAR